VSTIAPALGGTRGRAPRPVLLAIAAGWAIALGAQVTGTAGTFHHHGPIEGGPPLWAALLLFLFAWQAMVAAMMLPSSLPLIRLFEAASGSQERPGRARAAFLGGYAAVWTGFGAVAFLGDAAVQRTVEAVPWLWERQWVVAAGALAVAGAFQFSDLKERCLSKCRHPGPYLLAHYRRGAAAGFRLGSGHGLFCLGCCWALMLVMFAVGVAVFWWMAALTALMVYEKVGRHGATVARTAGVALLGAAALELAHPAWLPAAVGGPRSFASDIRIGPGPVTRVVRSSGYQLDLRIAPNRATRRGTVSMNVRKGDQVVNGARVRARFTMLDMDMGGVTVRLPQTGPGTYSASEPVLGMAGRWGLRFEIVPPGGRSSTLMVVDRIGP